MQLATCSQPGWSACAGLCWVGLIFVCSFDITPIALTDKVLVHIVFPRCEIVSIEFLGGKSASHLSIHVKTSSSL